MRGMIATVLLLAVSGAHAADSRWDRVTSVTINGLNVPVYVDTYTVKTSGSIKSFWVRYDPVSCDLFNKKALKRCETKIKWQVDCDKNQSQVIDWVTSNKMNNQTKSGSFQWTGLQDNVPESIGEHMTLHVCSVY